MAGVANQNGFNLLDEAMTGHLLDVKVVPPTHGQGEDDDADHAGAHSRREREL